jgi:hypothetical protein
MHCCPVEYWGICFPVVVAMFLFPTVSIDSSFIFLNCPVRQAFSFECLNCWEWFGSIWHGRARNNLKHVLETIDLLFHVLDKIRSAIGLQHLTIM